MSMILKNNLESLRTLNILNQNSSAMQKSLEKISSGQKIISAKDDSSAYAISEKMREQIRSLFQGNQNLQNGISLLKVVDGAVGEIVDELRNLKELAINAANDTNTDKDRKIIQKSFDQKKENINDIATTTNFNGKVLLDGTYYRKKVSDKGATIISAGDYSIESDGVYILAAGYTGKVTINATNVYLTQSDPTTTLNDVEIVGPGGNANLWIENLNIENTADKNIIQFQGSGNYLTVNGKNTLKYDGSGHRKAVINSGNDLTIMGDGKINLSNGSSGGTGIGSDANGTAGDITIADDVTVFFEKIGIDLSGAGIGSGNGGTIGNIFIGGNATVSSVPNDSYSRAIWRGAGIGSGYNGTAGNITICENAKVTANTGNGDGAGIGGGGHDNGCGNITIAGKANVTANSYYGAGIGCGHGFGDSVVGDITISNSATVNASSRVGEAIGRSDYATDRVGTISYVDGLDIKLNVTKQKMPDGLTYDSNPLKIQHGTKANQAINLYAEDMHTKSLGIEEVKVTTRQDATAAIGKIDDAIDYALNEATYVGADLQRLDYTNLNVVIMSENVQSAESRVRDADLAKEFTAYTKNNVLLQAAQAMLAQANQNIGRVVTLLQ